MVMYDPSTWHYGITARWWAEFATTGPEIDFFRRYVEAGEPALDVACGTGRLLLPYLRAGLDVDGCDVSPDMLAHCRAAAERERLTPNLYELAMCDLELPRRYRTVFVCGGFGLGSTREQDLEALRRMHDHLEPGGMLVLDNEVPYASGAAWRAWGRETLEHVPLAVPLPSDRRLGSDGAEYALSTRLVTFDPLDQSGVWELRGFMWRDGQLVAEEEHRLTMRLYFRNELVLMLERSGFVDISVCAGYTGSEPTGAEDFLVFTARRRP
jgi:SAM-dependent methyltransferase